MPESSSTTCDGFAISPKPGWSDFLRCHDGFYQAFPHRAVHVGMRFSVTRFFCEVHFGPDPQNYRQLKRHGNRLLSDSFEMCHGWGEQIAANPGRCCPHREICRQFDKFIVEIQKIQALARTSLRPITSIEFAISRLESENTFSARSNGHLC